MSPKLPAQQILVVLFQMLRRALGSGALIRVAAAEGGHGCQGCTDGLHKVCVVGVAAIPGTCTLGLPLVYRVLWRWPRESEAICCFPRDFGGLR